MVGWINYLETSQAPNVKGQTRKSHKPVCLTKMFYRIRCSGIFCKSPCGACLSRAGIERQGQGINGQL